MIIDKDYVSLSSLIIIRDSVCGFNVFAKYGYKDIYVHFHTDSDDLIFIMKQIDKVFKNQKNLKGDN